MKPWKITFKAKVWTDQDATGAQLAAVAELIGDSWDAVNPWSGPRALMAWLAVLIAPETGLDSALGLVYAMPVSELLEALTDPDDLNATPSAD